MLYEIINMTCELQCRANNTHKQNKAIVMLVWRSSYVDVEVKLCWCGGQVMLMWRSSYVDVEVKLCWCGGQAPT
jgi:hypothetical protein